MRRRTIGRAVLRFAFRDNGLRRYPPGRGPSDRRGHRVGLCRHGRVPQGTALEQATVVRCRSGRIRRASRRAFRGRKNQDRPWATVSRQRLYPLAQRTYPYRPQGRGGMAGPRGLAFRVRSLALATSPRKGRCARRIQSEDSSAWSAQTRVPGNARRLPGVLLRHFRGTRGNGGTVNRSCRPFLGLGALGRYPALAQARRPVQFLPSHWRNLRRLLFARPTVAPDAGPKQATRQDGRAKPHTAAAKVHRDRWGRLPKAKSAA